MNTALYFKKESLHFDTLSRIYVEIQISNDVIFDDQLYVVEYARSQLFKHVLNFIQMYYKHTRTYNTHTHSFIHSLSLSLSLTLSLSLSVSNSIKHITCHPGYELRFLDQVVRRTTT